MPPRARYCPRCGWSSGPNRTGERVAYGLVLLLVGVPALLVGGCFAFVGLIGAGSVTSSSADQGLIVGFGLIGLVGIGIFLLLLWLFIRSFRR